MTATLTGPVTTKASDPPGWLPPGLDRATSALRANPHLTTYAGLALATTGVVLVIVGWGQVAGETSVARQLPYVVSAGIGGLALVVIGLVVVSLAARRAESAERRRQISELTETLVLLRAVVAGTDLDDEEDW